MAAKPPTRFDALIDELCSRQGWCEASRERERLRPLAGDAAGLVEAILVAEGMDSARVDATTRAGIAERVHDWLGDPAGVGVRSGLA